MTSSTTLPFLYLANSKEGVPMPGLLNFYVKKGFRILCLFLLFGDTADGQFRISGKVIDEQSGEPLAFVDIIFNNDVLTGTTSDISGRFTYSSAIPITALTFSYVGYEKITLPYDSTATPSPLFIKMHLTEFELGEVVVKAGENPANRIIRKVIENKIFNDPENIASFTYQSYNKVIYDFEYRDTLSPDEVQLYLDNTFSGGHALIMESVTERKFIRPDNSEEIILGTKVSGFKEASFAPLATDIQPLSFYRDILPILDVNYLNPVSNGSLSKYDFTVKDTLYQGSDSVFILSYKPQPGKNFDGLTGLLYINTNLYAIQYVTARPFKPGFIDINLQQQYSLVDGKQWFPEQLKFELFVRPNQGMSLGVNASGVTIIDQVVLNAPLKKKDFGLEAVRMDEMANHRDSLYWNEHRPIPLNEKEEITYRTLDSLGKKYKFDNLLNVMEKIGQNRIPIHFIDLDISRVISFNKYEGVRLGLGAYTNDKLNRHFAVGGFFGYGFKDAGWKYGGEAIFTMDKEKDWQLTVSHQYEVRETGKTELNYFRPRQFAYRSWIASQMDRLRQNSMTLKLRMLKYARVAVSFTNTHIDPQYVYAFQLPESNAITQYTNTDITINLLYTYKEKLIQSMGQRISMGTRYPVLSLSYTRGIKEVLSSQFNYNKIEARLDQTVYFRNLGESRIRIEAGYIDQPLPYGLLFTGEGGYIQNWSVLIKNSFQTAKPYEFLSDRYVSFFYSHNFGSLLLHIGNWKPSITVFQNMGWGALTHPEYHRDITFRTKEKGLYESGFQLDNLIRFRYFNVSYVGLGAGMCYRYGQYATGRVSDDLAFTLSVSYSTK